MKNIAENPMKNKKKKKMMTSESSKNILSYLQKWKTLENQKKREEKKKLREL